MIETDTKTSQARCRISRSIALEMNGTTSHREAASSSLQANVQQSQNHSLVRLATSGPLCSLPSEHQHLELGKLVHLGAFGYIPLGFSGSNLIESSISNLSLQAQPSESSFRKSTTLIESSSKSHHYSSYDSDSDSDHYEDDYDDDDKHEEHEYHEEHHHYLEHDDHNGKHKKKKVLKVHKYPSKGKKAKKVHVVVVKDKGKKHYSGGHYDDKHDYHGKMHKKSKYPKRKRKRKKSKAMKKYGHDHDHYYYGKDKLHSSKHHSKGKLHYDKLGKSRLSFAGLFGYTLLCVNYLMMLEQPHHYDLSGGHSGKYYHSKNSHYHNKHHQDYSLVGLALQNKHHNVHSHSKSSPIILAHCEQLLEATNLNPSMEELFADSSSKVSVQNQEIASVDIELDSDHDQQVHLDGDTVQSEADLADLARNSLPAEQDERRIFANQQLSRQPGGQRLPTGRRVTARIQPAARQLLLNEPQVGDQIELFPVEPQVVRRRDNLARQRSRNVELNMRVLSRARLLAGGFRDQRNQAGERLVGQQPAGNESLDGMQADQPEMEGVRRGSQQRQTDRGRQQEELVLDMPDYALTGDSIELTCKHGIPLNRLYSVKWFKDSLEFYRFIPANRARSKSSLFLPDIRLDLARSNSEQLYLRNITHRASGLYRCEVVSEGPNFETRTGEKRMQVYSLPDSGPQLNLLEQAELQVSEPPPAAPLGARQLVIQRGLEPTSSSSLDAGNQDGGGLSRTRLVEGPIVRCVSARSYPAAHLTFSVNNRRVEVSRLLENSTIDFSDGLESNVLSIRLELSDFRSSSLASTGTGTLDKAASLKLNPADNQMTRKQFSTVAEALPAAPEAAALRRTGSGETTRANKLGAKLNGLGQQQQQRAKEQAGLPNLAYANALVQFNDKNVGMKESDFKLAPRKSKAQAPSHQQAKPEVVDRRAKFAKKRGDKSKQEKPDSEGNQIGDYDDGAERQQKQDNNTEAKQMMRIRSRKPKTGSKLDRKVGQSNVAHENEPTTSKTDEPTGSEASQRPEIASSSASDESNKLRAAKLGLESPLPAGKFNEPRERDAPNAGGLQKAEINNYQPVEKVANKPSDSEQTKRLRRQLRLNGLQTAGESDSNAYSSYIRIKCTSSVPSVGYEMSSELNVPLTLLVESPRFLQQQQQQLQLREQQRQQLPAAQGRQGPDLNLVRPSNLAGLHLSNADHVALASIGKPALGGSLLPSVVGATKGVNSSSQIQLQPQQHLVGTNATGQWTNLGSSANFNSTRVSQTSRVFGSSSVSSSLRPSGSRAAANQATERLKNFQQAQARQRVSQAAAASGSSSRILIDGFGAQTELTWEGDGVMGNLSLSLLAFLTNQLHATLLLSTLVTTFWSASHWIHPT